MEENREQGTKIAFESLNILISRWIDGSFTEIIDDWKWIFTYSARHKWAIVFYTILGLVSATLGLVSSVVSKHLLDIITGYQTERLGLLIGVMVGSVVFNLIAGSLLSRYQTKLSIDIHNDIRSDIFDKIVNADWLALSGYSSGDILNRFNADVSTVSANAITWLPSIIITVYHFAATFFVILRYDWVMAVLAFASAPMMFLMSTIVLKRRRAYARRSREMSSEMMSFEVETFYNLDTIKSFGVSGRYSEKLRWWQKTYKDFSLKYNLFNIKTGIVSSIFGTLIQWGAFGYCLWRLWSHDITYGTMTLFLQQRSKLSSAFSSLVGIIPAFLNSSISAHRIRELVQLPRDHAIAQSCALDQYAGQGFSIRMKDLTFGYVKDQKVICDSELVARPGEIIAIVGPSGEGKTTLIRLILGLVRPQQGEVSICTADGMALAANAETRRFFSYVPQGNTIFSGTIADNLRMIRSDATDEELKEALEIACAWEFVSRLPEGIQSRVGERGQGLSEGQAQRIAIARAVLRDAPVLLLDEATSALDVTTERQVLRNIMIRRPNRTCIVTTHRPSALEMCQRVYRVMDARITELDEEEAGRMAIDF